MAIIIIIIIFNITQADHVFSLLEQYQHASCFTPLSLSTNRSAELSDISGSHGPYTGRITSLAINISLSSAKLKRFSRRTDPPAHPYKWNACLTKEIWLPTRISPVLPEVLSEGTVCALLSCLSLLSFCSLIYSLLWSSFANSYDKQIAVFKWLSKVITPLLFLRLGIVSK